MRAVGGPGSQHGCWLLTYLFRAHPLHLCHYQQWHSQKAKQKEKHLLLTATTLHGSRSKLPLIGSRFEINVSGRSSLTNHRAPLQGAPDALAAATPKTSASGGKCLNPTASSICRNIISLGKKKGHHPIYVDQMCRCGIKAATDYAAWPFCPGAFGQWNALESLWWRRTECGSSLIQRVPTHREQRGWVPADSYCC